MGVKKLLLQVPPVRNERGLFRRFYIQRGPRTPPAASPQGRMVLNSAHLLATYTSLQIFQEFP